MTNGISPEKTCASLKHIVDHLPIACVLRDTEYNIIHINQATADLFNLTATQEYCMAFEELSPPYQPDGTPSKSQALVLMRDCMESGQAITFDWLHCRKDKELIPTVVTLIRVEFEGTHYLMGFKQDMRESQQARIAERANRLRMQAMLDSCPLACAIVDEYFNVMDCNHEVVNLFGILNRQMFIDRYFELSPEYQPDGRLSRQKALDKLQQSFEAGRANYEWLHQSLTGEQIPCETTLVRVRLDDQDLAIIYIRDLREIKKSIAMVEKMESIAYTDELTALYSRRYFGENAGKTLEECKEKSTPFHLIMVDLDHFKNVNDTYGHPVGDEVLKIAAARMSNVTRQGTILARYGGEEFIIMLTEMPYDAAVKTAQRIQKVIERSRFMIKGLGIDVTVSLGVATLSDPTESLDDIISMADVALYNAKRTGRNKVMEYQNVANIDWVKS